MAKSKKVGSIHAAAVVLGSKGGKRGGPARARKLKPGRRSEIAAQGGRAKAEAEPGRRKAGKSLGPQFKSKKG